MTDSFTYDSTNGWSTPILYKDFSLRHLATTLCFRVMLRCHFRVTLPTKTQSVKNVVWNRHQKGVLGYSMKIRTIILKHVACDKYKQFCLLIKSVHTHLSVDTQLRPCSAFAGNVHIETLVSGLQISFNDQANSQVQTLD